MCVVSQDCSEFVLDLYLTFNIKNAVHDHIPSFCLSAPIYSVAMAAMLSHPQTPGFSPTTWRVSMTLKINI